MYQPKESKENNWFKKGGKLDFIVIAELKQEFQVDVRNFARFSLASACFRHSPRTFVPLLSLFKQQSYIAS